MRRALDPIESRVPDLIYKDTRLLVSELVTNSVRHVPAERAGDIKLVVEQTNGSLRVEVRDEGPGPPPKPSRPPSAGQAHGWGLELLDRIADRWGTESHDDGAMVWFELDLRATG